MGLLDARNRSHVEPEDPHAPDVDGGPRAGSHRHHRRWWVILSVVGVIVIGLVLVYELWPTGARPVTLKQAQSRISPAPAAPANGRPSPGVYSYTGTGSDRLSLLSLSQAEGPTVPGTIQFQGDLCWTLRLDYSNHHWQSWQFCRHGGDLWQSGGQVWQLWQIGPANFTNLTTTTCETGTLALPADPRAGQTWPSRCSGTSTQVRGTMQTAGTTTYLGHADVDVAGHPVDTIHLVVDRTDTGAQTGHERYEMWVKPDTGLPVKLVQEIKVSTDTPIGRSTYTQTGTLTLSSLSPAP